MEREGEIFVAALGASQYTHVAAVRSQKKEDFIIANRNALYYFGGVPASIMPETSKIAETSYGSIRPNWPWKTSKGSLFSTRFSENRSYSSGIFHALQGILHEKRENRSATCDILTVWYYPSKVLP